MFLRKTIGALLISTVALFGADFKEGVNYTVLDKPFNVEKGSVIKAWSYTCPFCYKYDKAVTEKVIKSIPNVKFEVWHLATKGTYGKQASKLMAVAHLRDENKNKSLFDKDSTLKKMKFAYYKAYLDKKMRWDSGEDAFYKEGFKILNIDRAGFEKEVATPAVQDLLKRWEGAYPIAKVQGIPGFVVNGKYLLTTKKIISRDYMIELIKHLQTK